MSNPSSLINKLSELNDTNTVSAFVPSINKKLNFKGLNIKQQKDIISTVADGPISGITLNTCINNMIMSNVTEECSLNIIDRYPVALAIRKGFINKDVKVGDSDISIDLNEHIKECTKKIKSEKIQTEFEINVDNVSIIIKVPSLEKDNEINKKIKKVDESNIGDTIGDLYISEIIKFIDTISIGEGEEEEKYIFKDIGYHSATKIIEAMPASINQKIIDIIGEVRDLENLFLKTSEGDIEITAAFFSSE
jgi:hypothetical protein